MENQTTKDLVFKNLDNIYKSVENTAKQFEVTAIPMNLIETTVNKVKIDITRKLRRKSSKEDVVFFEEYNKMLDYLISGCNDIALEMGATKMPLLLFESQIDILKSAFESGITHGVGE